MVALPLYGSIARGHVWDHSPRRPVSYDTSAVEQGVWDRELRDAMDDVLADLLPRERAVILLRFGFDGRELKLREVSAGLEALGIASGTSVETIRSVEAKALRKLRHPRRSDALQRHRDRPPLPEPRPSPPPRPIQLDRADVATLERRGWRIVTTPPPEPEIEEPEIELPPCEPWEVGEVCLWTPPLRKVPYVYQEYPRMLFDVCGGWVIVADAEQRTALEAQGYRVTQEAAVEAAWAYESSVALGRS